MSEATPNPTTQDHETYAPLGLHEELLLLMLRDERGTIAPGTMYQQALAGAILAELVLLSRIDVDEEHARVTDPSPTGDDVLDECLAKMDASRRARALRDWISRLSGTRELKDKVADHLVALGVLRREKDRVLFVFPRTRYPEVTHGPEGEIVTRLWKAVFGGGEIDNARTAMLLSIAHASDVLRLVFDPRDLKRRRARIEAISNGDLIGPATGQVIRAAQAAVVAACAAAAAVAVTS